MLNSPIINLRKEINLLGNKTECYTIQFDVTPIIENNSGPIDLDEEADKIVIWNFILRF
jgi:hypothetical protein